MIRINLLPVPKVRKQLGLIIQAVVGLGILLAVAGFCYTLGIGKKNEIQRISQQIQQKEREIRELQAKVGEVEKYKTQAKALEEQLGVIKALENGRAGPVKMMDELTALIPKKLWINSFKESAKRVTIDGVADGGPIIADFLDNLKTAKHFSNPQLSIVQSQEQEGFKLQKFTITMGVKYDI